MMQREYIEFAKNSIPKGMDFEGMKIVVDCANGAAYKVVNDAARAWRRGNCNRC